MTTSNIPIIHGWREALVSVSNIDNWIETYQLLGNWEVRHRGPVDDSMLQFLGLPPGSSAEEALLAEKGSHVGFTRLIRFDTGSPTPVIRSNARPWEVGGWYDLNARVDDMKARFAEVQQLGWSAESDPIQWKFSDVIVKEWLVRGPDGVVFAMIERIDPPLPPEEQPGPFSAHINATQFVADIAAARHFYQQVLGFKPLIEVTDELFIPEPAPNVLGLPAETAAQQKWNISLHQATGDNGGWLEILSLPGISGRNFAAEAHPPNRGILSLRFPTADIAALHAHLQKNDVSIIQPPTALTLHPYGDITLMTVEAPHGARLDFISC